MNTKAVFFDIDGTLVGLYDRKVPQSTRRALEEMRRKGIRLFICSGRAPGFRETLTKEVDFAFDGYVFLNGQYCVDGEGTCFYELSFRPETTQQVYTWLKEHPQVEWCAMERDYTYASPKAGMPEGYAVVDDLDRMLAHTLYQVCPFIGPEQDEDFLNAVSGAASARWIDWFADVIPAEGGKNVGMQQMLDHFGIRREESIAFGDGGNDIPMLRYAGVGVAMGNAKDDVKESADYVTADVDDDGIYKALRHFGVIEE